ncbi:MAG: DUF2332 domain-containing protein [Acidimicrobiia bacterium]
MAERDGVAEVLAFQADACRIVGSGLYERILQGALADLEAGGVCARVLDDHHEDPFGSALALRFLGAVHRIVLEGRAPALEAVYPSVGGDPAAGDPVAAFLATVADHEEEVRVRLSDGVQTNEVGRSAALIGGYLDVVRRTGLPLRVLEIGASAGLNLRFDRYGYDTGAQVAGDPASPLRFEGFWEPPLPDLSGALVVTDRRGCDRNPLDATSEADRLTLLSFVWPDQTERLARLRAALTIAQQIPVAIDHADAAEWAVAQLDEVHPGAATVLVHSIVLQYLSPARRRDLREAVADAGRRATASAPVAWLRMEPATDDAAEVRLTLWPGGEDRLLGTAGYHGPPVRWAVRR